MTMMINWILKVVPTPSPAKPAQTHFSEFRVILQDDYQPSSQGIMSDNISILRVKLSVCDFNGIKFADGAERAVECNGW